MSRLFPPYTDRGSFAGFVEAQAASPLLVHAEHLRQARGNKCVAVLWMYPRDFLALTTTALDMDWDREIDHRPVQLLVSYNRYAAPGGDNIIMPLLKVVQTGPDRGRVTGHEGRHRAAAVMRDARGKRFPVAISLADEQGYLNYYDETQVLGECRWTKHFYGLAEIPRTLLPQQWRGVVNRTRPVVLDSATFVDALELWKEEM